MVTFFCIVLVGALLLAFTTKKTNINETMDVARLVCELRDFTPEKTLLGCDSQAGISVDNMRHKVCLVVRNGGQYSNKIIGFRDLLSVELFQDGYDITRTGQTSMLDGASIGTISHHVHAPNMAERVVLRIRVNDPAAPLHEITLQTQKRDKKDRKYLKVMENAWHWHGVLDVLIQRGKEDARIRHDAEAVQRPASVADELKKLAELQSAGILTSDEFQQQKAKLLGTV